MRTLVKITLFFIILLSSLNANAQVGYSYYDYSRSSSSSEKKTEIIFKGGMNFSHLSGFPDSKIKIGYTIGINTNFYFDSNWYFGTGFEVLNKGARSYQMGWEGSQLFFEDATINAVYAQVPLHVGYKFDLSNTTKLSIHGGPYLAYGFFGSINVGNKLRKIAHDGKVTVESVDEFTAPGSGAPHFKRKWSTFSPAVHKNHDRLLKRPDFGLGLGVNLDYKRMVYGLNYDFGLIDISRTEEYNLKNMAGQLTVGYKF